MKAYQIVLTQQELEVILKTLDSTQTRGIETSRCIVALADKIVALVKQENGKSVSETTPTVPAQAPEEN